MTNPSARLHELTGEIEADLPPCVLDPLMRFKVDVWQSAQLNALHRLRQAGAGASRPLRVVFLVPDTSLWDVYGSIYAEMKAHPFFEPKVLAFCRVGISGAVGERETREFFKTREISAELVGFDGIEPEPIRPDQADVLFYTLGSVAYPPSLQIEFTSLSFLTCYLPYGFLLAREYEYQFNQEFHHAAWRVFAATPREEALYGYYSHRRVSNVALTGYPKFDSLFSLPRHTLSRPSVIWAPHWTIGEVYPRLNLGTFHLLCMSMLEVFDDYPQIDFVYKPHPTLAHALEQTSFMSLASYATYLDMLRSRPNIRIWMHGDYAEMFARSSAMITDSVSFLAEYLLAERPLLFLNRSDRAQLSPVGEEIVGLHYQGLTLGDIRSFIDRRVIDRHDPGAERRQRTAPKLLGVSSKRASDNIIAALLEALADKPTAETEPERPTRLVSARTSIDREATLNFFEGRAGRYEASTPYTSILYQDAAPEIARARDTAEKSLILPLLALQHTHRVLDIGCGVGRWADILLDRVSQYVGTDVSPGLIDHARQRLDRANAEFIVADAADLVDSLSAHRDMGFDRFIVSGLLLYLNDDDVLTVARAIAGLSRPGAVLYLREPLAVETRLTLDRHWSEELQAHYSAIYRTREEMGRLLNPVLSAAGYDPIEFNVLYTDPALQNRSETRQFFALTARTS